jgi:hypothetical protein
MTWYTMNLNNTLAYGKEGKKNLSVRAFFIHYVKILCKHEHMLFNVSNITKLLNFHVYVAYCFRRQQKKGGFPERTVDIFII